MSRPENEIRDPQNKIRNPASSVRNRKAETEVCSLLDLILLFGQIPVKLRVSFLQDKGFRILIAEDLLRQSGADNPSRILIFRSHTRS